MALVRQAIGFHQNVYGLVPARGNRNCRNGFPHHKMRMTMARVRYTIIRVPASTLGEAHEIIGHMTGLGFPRDRMNVTPHEDDTFHVAIHTRETDRDRVMDALHQTSAHVRPKLSAAALMLFAGGGAMLGAALWARRSAGGRSRVSSAERRSHDQPSGEVEAGNDVDRGVLGSGSFTGATSPNTGFSSANPPQAPSGLRSSLQPGGTLPGGGPGALVGSLGTGGGQAANRETGSLTPQGQ
jgi:hypothetical protein